MPIFEAILSLKSPMPQRRKLACKIPFFASKKAPVLKPHFNWTESLFPLLTDVIVQEPFEGSTIDWCAAKRGLLTDAAFLPYSWKLPAYS